MTAYPSVHVFGKLVLGNGTELPDECLVVVHIFVGERSIPMGSPSSVPWFEGKLVLVCRAASTSTLTTSAEMWRIVRSNSRRGTP